MRPERPPAGGSESAQVAYAPATAAEAPPAFPSLSMAEDALLAAAFGGGGRIPVPARSPLSADQAALLLASLGVPEAATDPDEAAGSGAAAVGAEIRALFASP